MRFLKPLLLLGLVLGLGFWLWTLVFPSPQKVIRKHLLKTAQLASFTTQEGALARVANVQSFANQFANPVEVNLDVPGVRGRLEIARDELLQYAGGARANLASLKVSFLDINVAVGPDKESATADLTLHVSTPEEPNFAVQEIKIVLRKVNGQWLITRVETVKTLTQLKSAISYSLAAAA